MLAIAWQYLVGSAFAAQLDARDEPEWPPHPDRVFMSLVASWGERGEAADERAALEWLEALPEPEIAAPGDDLAFAAAGRKVYVPANDRVSDTLVPTRKERYFPSTSVGDAVCALRWPGVDPGVHREAIARLVRGVTHVGHSASLVRMWIEPEPPPARWIPSRSARREELQLRVPEPGRLARLVRDFAGGGDGFRRPRAGAWCAYRLHEPEGATAGHHAGRMIVLRRIAGARPSIQHAPPLCAALRSALLRSARGEDARALVSGHAPDGTPLDRPHVAYVPLPFVGDAHADGHLLGLAIVLPEQATADQEDAVFRALVGAMPAETASLELTAGPGGAATFAIEDRPTPPRALRAGTWSRASTLWATTTPVVLDRQPPRRHPDRDGFAADEIALACERVGVARPIEVRVGDVSVLEGVPHAAAFPALPTKAGLRRRHVHAWLRFERPVLGPLLLGAGRYRGHGLCRPLDDEAAR